MEGRIQQRCRFCQQTRAVRLPPSELCEQLAQLIHEHTATIAALERRISTHEAIRLILRVLVLEEITLGQAIGILAETAERSAEAEDAALYQQAEAALRLLQAKES